MSEKKKKSIRDFLNLEELELPFDFDNEASSKKLMPIKRAAEFEDAEHEYLWEPYIPIGNFTVLMASGGTGKSILTCGIAAAITTGRPLYGMEEPPKPGNILFVSAEDTGADYKGRLKASGADLTKVFIMDKTDSIGLTYDSDLFEDLLDEIKPVLVVVDPWHAFAGDIDINRINIVRPLYQRLDQMADEHHCAIVLVSHVNKRAQEGNANNAAVGSVDFVNASRSAMQLIYDERDENQRILVHTKTNHRKFGKSLVFRIVKHGGIEWVETSPVTRFTLEEAAGRRRKPQDITDEKAFEKNQAEKLLQAIDEIIAENPDKREINLAYQRLTDLYGEDIFWGRTRQSECFKCIRNELLERGIRFQIAQVKYQGKTYNGVKLLISAQETDFSSR